MIRALRWSAVVALLGALSGTALASAGEGLSGFAPASAARQRVVEAAFAAIPSPERTRDWHRTFTAEPHPAGSERNNELARHHRRGVEEAGPRGRGRPPLRRPQHRAARGVADDGGAGALRGEPARGAASTPIPTRGTRAVSPGYLGISASADVDGARRLRAQRQPGGLRGPAQERHRRAGQDRPRPLLEPVQLSRLQGAHRASARARRRCSSTATPRRTATTRGQVFPDGPWGPESHIQRGAITYDFIVPGDPLTPGWASLPGARQ